ncbi:HAMP domain-containing histidine kinase [bacterium]|nr:HAMP domain-containing histidine kinase [bacterium]
MATKPPSKEGAIASSKSNPETTSLDEMGARLDDLNRGFFQGVARLVHDVNSPLTALQTAIDLLEHELKVAYPEARPPELDIVLSSLGNMGQLISSWQDVLHRDTPAYTPVNARSTVEQAVERIRALHPQIAVQVTSAPMEDQPEDEWLIDAEPFALEQTIALLLNNAVEATIGAQSPTISIGLELTPQELILVMDNNGEKVPEEMRTSLWKDFVTTKEGHFGLGLGIVRYVLMRHGGSIQMVESKVGGTAFKVTIRRKMRQMISF